MPCIFTRIWRILQSKIGSRLEYNRITIQCSCNSLMAPRWQLLIAEVKLNPLMATVHLFNDKQGGPSLFLPVFLPLFVKVCSLIYSGFTWYVKRCLFMSPIRSVCQRELVWALWTAGQGPVLEGRCPVHLCQLSPPSLPVRTCSGWYSRPSSPLRPLDRLGPLAPQPWPSRCHWLTHMTCQAPVILLCLDSPLRVQTLQARHRAPPASPGPVVAVHERSLWVKMEMLVC